MLVKVKQFLTKSDVENPVPFKTMEVVAIKKETSKAMLVELKGKPIPQSECIHCGREIKHPQSLYFGIGSTCIKHFPELLAVVDYDDVEESYELLKKEMENIRWEGWLPKRFATLIKEDGWLIIFKHNNKQYRVRTTDEKKMLEIRAKAEEIIEFIEIKM